MSNLQEKRKQDDAPRIVHRHHSQPTPRTPRPLTSLPRRHAPMNPSRWEADALSRSPTSCQSLFPLRTCDDRRYTQTATDLPSVRGDQRWGVSRYHSDSLVLAAPRRPMEINLVSVPALLLPPRTDVSNNATITPLLAPKLRKPAEMQMTWKRSRSSIRRRLPARTASKRVQPVQEMEIIWEREIPYEKNNVTASDNQYHHDDVDDDHHAEEAYGCSTTKMTTPPHNLGNLAFGMQFLKCFECPSSLLSIASKTTLQLLETACLLICDSFPSKIEESADEEQENDFFFSICGGDVVPISPQLE